MISSIQRYEHHPDGRITIAGQPGITVDVIEQQGHTTARDLKKELGLPHFYEEWEALAQHRGLSRRLFLVQRYMAQFRQQIFPEP